MKKDGYTIETGTIQQTSEGEECHMIANEDDAKLSGKDIAGKMFSYLIIKCPCCEEKFMYTEYEEPKNEKG